jgi:hypothetical protein
MFKKYSPLLIVLITIIIIGILNTSLNKFLIGWDNLLPELDILIGLKRSLFSVWQEHQGLGLLAGNAHAAELIYQIYVFLLSLMLPTNLVRQVFSSTMLLLGTIGSYFLVKHIVRNEKNSLGRIAPMLGALFYTLNLSTIQTFYVPFEPFIIHYGFLPWLILAFFKLLKNSDVKNTMIFILLNILAISQSQVPTVFFVYLITLAIISLYLNLKSKTKALLFKTIKAFLIIFIINAFWILPFIYFTATNSHVAFEAKINQMSTETVFLQNKEFGNIYDVMLLKGFWFNNVDPDIYGNFSYMFTPWKDYLGKTYVLGIGYILFAIIFLGVIKSFKRKLPALTAFIILFVFSLTMLTTTTPPFSWIDSILRQIPLFSQAFRFPFTKFSILLSLCFAVFFAIGTGEVIFKLKKINSYFLSLFFIFLLILFTLPIFRGDLFYYKNRVLVPNEYFKLFEYFKNKDQNSRIANFPQYTFWGWNYYKWGYGGSGFLWYGINQPILDRAFDVWSREDENYYWEISRALNSNDSKLFEQILNKYQISYILLDGNIVNPSSPNSFLDLKLKNILSKIPSINKDQAFGNITIYKVSLKDNPSKFIFSENNLKTVNSYKWGDFDKAYKDLGNYISTNNDPDVIYPFRSIFYGKNKQDKNILTLNNMLELTSSIPKIQLESQINYPFIKEEELAFVNFRGDKDKNGNFLIQANVENPEISFVSNNYPQYKVSQTSFQKDIFSVPPNTQYPLFLNAGGFANFTIESSSVRDIGSTSLSLKEDNLIALSNDGNINLSADILANDLNNAVSIDTKDTILGNVSQEIRVTLPKVSNGSERFSVTPNKNSVNSSKNCNNFRKGKINSEIISEKNKSWLRLKANNATNCISYFLPSFNHLHGYTIFIENRNIKGRPLHFWILNEGDKVIPIDTYLNPENNLSALILPPQSKDGLSFSLHFESVSIGDNEVINDLGKIDMIPIPYSFLASINIEKKNVQESKETFSLGKINHPNQALYVIDSIQGKNGTIILSQSYNPNWRAYSVKNINFLTKFLPFFFGKEIKDHKLINNWENGWRIKDFNDNAIIIVFLPQYLEYFGFFILLFLPLFIAISKLKN